MTGTASAQPRSGESGALAGQFSWEAQIACCLDSREWTSNAGGGTYRFFIEPSYLGGAYVRAYGTVYYP
ncbi:hypothetical protein [Lentzea sp. NPDC059081]|uniref:hypothetical protein n=1 Tax=Lentzea sp. NPDC059081 TaxID=3346719 RepID=UPI0036B62921